VSAQLSIYTTGDNLFSYRFPEVASCGAIPVVYADDWQLPFTFDVVDWQEAVVIIPEIDAEKSREILEAIPHEKRCRMRQKALEIYESHLATPLKTMATIIEGMERLAQRDMKTYTGDRKQVQPSSVAFLESGLCAPSPITDHTLCYRDNIERPWLGDTSKELPPVMLLLSSYGWNNPKPERKHPIGTWYRSMRTRELVEGVINHPMFHPNGFEKYINHGMKLYSKVTYIFFLDMESCAEPSYPHYGYQKGLVMNADTSGGRTIQFKDRSHRYLKDLWRVVELMGIDFRVVFFDCSRTGPFALRENNRDPHLSLASVSASRSQVLEGFDQGMPLPAYRSFALSENLRAGICNDEKRPILLSFSGHLYSHPRKLLRELHNGNDVLIGSPKEHREWMDNSTADPYFDLAVRSQFAAVPRGLHLGTSRLVEMMSAGAIPVIFADHWVLPLDRTIPWSEIAVILPEEDARIAVELLSSISTEKRCQMRTKMMEMYDKYLATGEGVISGLVKGIQATGRITKQMMAPVD
jgi:glucuronyl/N-acetylglucosaminyl transferase EXT1